MLVPWRVYAFAAKYQYEFPSRKTTAFQPTLLGWRHWTFGQTSTPSVSCSSCTQWGALSLRLGKFLHLVVKSTFLRGKIPLLDVRIWVDVFLPNTAFCLVNRCKILFKMRHVLKSKRWKNFLDYVVRNWNYCISEPVLKCHTRTGSFRFRSHAKDHNLKHRTTERICKARLAILSLFLWIHHLLNHWAILQNDTVVK